MFMVEFSVKRSFNLFNSAADSDRKSALFVSKKTFFKMMAFSTLGGFTPSVFWAIGSGCKRISSKKGLLKVLFSVKLKFSD